MKKTMQIQAAMNVLALAGLLAFVATPASAATTVTPPATPTATSPAANPAAAPAAPATPTVTIDAQGTETPDIGEVEAADEVSNIAEHEVEMPEVAHVDAPEIETPQVNIPETE